MTYMEGENDHQDEEEGIIGLGDYIFMDGDGDDNYAVEVGTVDDEGNDSSDDLGNTSRKGMEWNETPAALDQQRTKKGTSTKVFFYPITYFTFYYLID